MCGGAGTNAVRGEAQALAAAPAAPAPAAALVEVSFEEINIIDEQPPPVYYVIIGRGPMAITNHRTLLATPWGQARIGGRTVLHIGFPNPWPRYLNHGLGQPNHLLSFPGMINQPHVNGPELDGGLESHHFGAQFDAEFASFQNTEVAEEWVALIQSRERAGQVDGRIGQEEGGDVVSAAVTARLGDPWPAFGPDQALYRLCLYDPETEQARWVYAAAIDICTGPGRPNVFSPLDYADRDDDPPEIEAARTPPWLTPERWSAIPRWRDRRVLNGVDAIRDEVQWANGDRICVTAGGGVGLNAAEKSRPGRRLLDWFGRDSLLPIFDNPRNITYLLQPGTNHRCPRGNRGDFGIDGEDDLIAEYRRHRMGCGAALRDVATEGNKIDVRLQVFEAPARIRDFWGNRLGLDATGAWQMSVAYRALIMWTPRRSSTLYDRLVIPNGQGTRHVGQPHAFARHLDFRPLVRANRMVALETNNGMVRILGAACNDYPGLNIQAWLDADSPEASASDRMWHYHRNLPVCAVPDGFIICGVNTALANEYFVVNPNLNVNTMTYDEILAVVNDADLAGTIVEQRHDNNGYADLADLQRVTGSQAPALAQFQYAY